MTAEDDLPAVPRRPRLTPANEARLAPVDAKSRESYELAEAAVASKVETGVKLDELLAKLAPPDDDNGAVPQSVLEISDSTIHRLDLVLHPAKKPPG